ncbi:HAD-like protein [Clavulina sp. PMI_390]|nr:HAD-like protein [Clavulina sp. PMI_390]
MEEEGITGWDEAEQKEIALGFQKLPAHKDTVPGLNALRTKYMICPLTNGGGQKIMESNKRNGMSFDLVLPSTVTGQYKPNPAVYEAAIRAFELKEGQCLAFVAAHYWDLAAAGKHGFKTIYIRREHTDINGVPPEVLESFDLVIEEGGIEGLARQLGVL